MLFDFSFVVTINNFLILALFPIEKPDSLDGPNGIYFNDYDQSLLVCHSMNNELHKIDINTGMLHFLVVSLHISPFPFVFAQATHKIGQ